MATYIVAHEQIDTDCALAMLALTEVIRQRGYKDEIRYCFVRHGGTFGGVEVKPQHCYEVWFDGQGHKHRVYHVDCAGGFYDHHRPDCRAPSSTWLIAQDTGLLGNRPEWRRLVEWADRADQGQLRGCALPALIRGQHRLLGPGHDSTIFRLVWRLVDGLLANEKIRVKAESTPIRNVAEFQLPEPEDTPALQVLDVEGFGKIGLLVGPEELGGSLRNRLEIQERCRLIVSFGTEESKVGIMSCFPQNADSVDLRSLGIIREIRDHERILRGRPPFSPVASTAGMLIGWFAHEVNGRVRGLYNGSSKVDLAEPERTLLPWELILQIVEECVLASTKQQENVKD